MNGNGCNGCARSVRIVNGGQVFCIDRPGVIYFVDTKWIEENGCSKRCSEILIKGR